MLTRSAACLACWAVELWKLGPVVLVVVAERGGVNHGQSRSVTVVDYSLLNCTSLTVNGAVTEIQRGNPAALSAGSYRLICTSTY